ncbi:MULTISPECIES: acyl-CoA dehydrogenase family protein [unclassified Chelatococcus]|uniref:acyl-CoA dehydrogenase family protein n=1 Tax=unclassified Chelatococcus TaxID=2638111 RepID=UPI001BD0E059|nr:MULTISPECIES: acyl-CoA dehydrogenase family protein [unclassified Chelatococcus]CAH1651159.1 Acyl-CoA dehydrogenase [Hyphomicrobiales bacterium]MBS7739820.1 acyl-CoA dehydrogenase family protein [Chelatococcus sp. HY11]MBX3545464.1 acyl-CoA dehydrogenase family protein [Chelatococcus sp.]MCO5078881.1 acyl-CoA dehydrogenase family protein [Chelatococcus sp.]CAH1686354.1 Acyl-CoA dehydrogenase [Hyphomicrobiales bacterium]
MIERTIYDSDHETFRDLVRRFFEREVAPYHAAWEEQGYVPRELWQKAGAAGLLCTSAPEEYGGLGLDRRYAAIIFEEQARLGLSGPGFSVHSEIAAPYIVAYGSDELKRRWLPGLISGEVIAAAGLTEPGAGSDLANIKTTALRDGDHYIVNGQKTFISNGHNCDLVALAVKTDPTQRSKGVSMLLVEADRPGFSKGAPLHKLGNKAQDTCELFFDNVRVPVSNLLGVEGEGFTQLMQELPWERVQIAVSAIATAEGVLEETLRYVKERKAFGKQIIEFQANRFTLAELQTELQIGRVFVDRCLELVCDGKLDSKTAAMAKYWSTDFMCKLIDNCLQLHGGYGYMVEYPVARAFADARVTRIYGGTNEIMKEIIGRSL